jgi:hypothetical protein
MQARPGALGGVGEAAPTPQGDAPPEAATRRKVALKVFGQDHALEFDDGTASALARVLGVESDQLESALQKTAAGSRALSEAAKERKAAAAERAQVQSLLEALRSDPDSVLEQLGVDADAMALKRLQARAQREAMTPEERAFSEREQALAKREAAIQAHEAKSQQAAQTQAEAAAFAEAQQTLLPALEASGLPRNHASLQLLANVGLEALDAGVDLTPQQVAAEARHRVQEMVGSVLRDAKPEALVALLGKENVRALMRHSVEQARTAQRPPPSTTVQAPRPPPKDEAPVFLRPSQVLRGA